MLTPTPGEVFGDERTHLMVVRRWVRLVRFEVVFTCPICQANGHPTCIGVNETRITTSSRFKKHFFKGNLSQWEKEDNRTQNISCYNTKTFNLFDCYFMFHQTIFAEYVLYPLNMFAEYFKTVY